MVVAFHFESRDFCEFGHLCIMLLAFAFRTLSYVGMPYVVAVLHYSQPYLGLLAVDICIAAFVFVYSD